MRLIDGRFNGREISRQFLVKTILLLYGTIVNGRSRTNGYWYVEYKTKTNTNVQTTALMHNPPPQIP